MIKLICIKETNVTMNEENIKFLSKVASEINCSISDSFLCDTIEDVISLLKEKQY